MRGDPYGDWSATGLAMSDKTKLRAIMDGICQAYNVGLEDVHQVHVFSNSSNTLCLTMDMSHHLGQHSSLSICKVLVPWLRRHPNNTVHFHHITYGVGLEDHQLVHILATSTCIKAGSVPVISAGFARCRVATQMLNGWNSLFWSKKYIGPNFLTLYQGKDTPLIPTHVNSGPWMCKVGHSHSLTACWRAWPHCTPWNHSIGTFDHHTNITFHQSANSCLPMLAVSAKATLSLSAAPSALPTVNQGPANLPITTTIPLLLP
jgi:hypothetical protein